MEDVPGRTAPPPNGKAEMVLETSFWVMGLLLVFFWGGSMEPKRKSFSGAVVAELVVGAAAGVDLRFPRGKACSVMVWCFFSRCYGCEAIGRFAMYDVYGWT